MLTIRKTLLVAVALAFAPTFALAQTGGETTKAPAAVTTQAATAPTKMAAASTTATKASASKLHKSRVRHAAKVKKTKTAKLARARKVADLDKTSKTGGAVMKVAPTAAQK
jgi:hypothetical protein